MPFGKSFYARSKSSSSPVPSPISGSTPAEDIDPNVMMAGFAPLVLRHAVWELVPKNDADGVTKFAAALGCGQNQALDVIDTLESREFITRAGKQRKWELARLGHRLVFGWKPPRRFSPAIQREDEAGTYGAVIESVRCSIRRLEDDDAVVFEEADLDVGVSVEFESDRVITVQIVQPDDYDGAHVSSSIEITAHISVDEAKTFFEGLRQTIARAEEEIARRAQVAGSEGGEGGTDDSQ